MELVKGITSTVIFESSAINGDVNIGIHSIKKLSRDNGVFSIFSRPSMRNKTFNTLNYLSGWEEAPLTFDEDVIQFRFPKANIIQYAEMDIFGFMNTSVLGSNKISVTRKSPVGMTKAISLEPYRSDTAFYANHSLVKRANAQIFSEVSDTNIKIANPNPYTKEEHYSIYRFSYTIDLCRLGFHEVSIITSSNSRDDKLKKALDGINEWINNFEPVAFQDVEVNPLYKLSVSGDQMQWYKIPSPNNAENKDEYILGYLGVYKTNNDKDLLLSFVVTKEERNKRLKDLLTVMINGLKSHSRTENYGINPIFITMAALSVPMPVFHSRIKWNGKGLDEKPLNELIEFNSYIKKAWVRDELGLCPGIKIKSEEHQGGYNELTSIEEVLKVVNGDDKGEGNKCS